MSVAMNRNASQLEESAELFAARHLEPVASELDHVAQYPSAVMQALAEDGYLGLLVPSQYGGAEVDFLEYLKVIQLFSASCAGVVSILNAHALAAYAITRWGSESQKSTYLPQLAKGTMLGACALTDAGPTPAMMEGSLLASPQSDGYVLNGQKCFVRNAGIGQVFITFATSCSANETTELKAFVVDADNAGVTVGPKVETMGLTACPVANLVFDNAELSGESMLGTKDDNSAIAAHLTGVARVMAAAQTLGIATAAARHAAEHASQRVQFNRPVAAFQAVQTLLADVQSNCYLACQGVYQAGRLIDAGEPFEVEAAMLKSFLARCGSKMLIDCCQVEGGLGISESAPKGIRESLPLARMFRDIVGTTLLDSPDDFPDGLIATGNRL